MIQTATTTQLVHLKVLKDEKKTHKGQFKKVKCNLCGKEFKVSNRFMRFCKECKDENELYNDYI